MAATRVLETMFFTAAEPAPPAEGPEDVPAEAPSDVNRNPAFVPSPLLLASAASTNPEALHLSPRATTLPPARSLPPHPYLPSPSVRVRLAPRLRFPLVRGCRSFGGPRLLRLRPRLPRLGDRRVVPAGRPASASAVPAGPLPRLRGGLRGQVPGVRRAHARPARPLRRDPALDDIAVRDGVVTLLTHSPAWPDSADHVKRLRRVTGIAEVNALPAAGN